jgi:hypothetical protein
MVMTEPRNKSLSNTPGQAVFFMKMRRFLMSYCVSSTYHFSETVLGVESEEVLTNEVCLFIIPFGFEDEAFFLNH